MTATVVNRKQAKMNILVSLRSFLLCESLCKTIGRELDGYKAVPFAHMEATEDFKPDMILVDFAGLSQEMFLKWPEGRVLLVDTGLSEDEMVRLMRSYKLYGVISLDADFHQFKKALSVIQDGQIWIDNAKLKAILHGKSSGGVGDVSEKLSKKEAQIMDLVAEGYKNKEIASMLFLSEQTVKFHLGRIFKKMHVTNRSQLVSLTIKNRIINQQAL